MVRHAGLVPVQTERDIEWRDMWGAYAEAGVRLGLYNSEEEAAERVAFWKEHGR